MSSADPAQRPDPFGIVSAVRRHPRRAAAAGGAAAVLVAAGLGTAALIDRSGPADAPAEADLHQAAPDCSAVPSEAVAEVLEEPRLDGAHRGPLEESDGSVCTWTSIGSAGGDAEPRFLRADFQALFTDSAGEVAGAQAAARDLAALEQAHRGAAPAPELGGTGQTWRPTADGSAAEAVFRHDNLIVRIAYGGADGPDGAPISYGDARSAALDVAGAVADEL
ncbi:hypothetical protein [Nocardiopsis coralliicola]